MVDHELDLKLKQMHIDQLTEEKDSLRKENAALKLALAEVERLSGQAREILRTVGNNLAVLHHE